MNQRTLARPVSFTGVGLHTGESTTVTFHPAEPESGICFVRGDLPGTPAVRVRPASAAGESTALRRTVLRQGPAEVHTVEHVLAALAGLGVDNARLVVSGLEVPEPTDGSAAPFVALLLEAGIVEQAAVRRPFVIRRPVVYDAGEVQIVGLPGEGLRLSFTLQFDNPVLGTQHRTFQVSPESFAREIAPARTFVLFRDVEALRAGGLIKGGSLRNAIVVKDDGILNQEPLRFPDEAVRHKILDLLGDLSLLGRPLQGQIHAIKSGHAHNVRFVRQLEKEDGPAAELEAMLDQVHFDILDIERIMPHRYPMLLVDRILHLKDRQRVIGLKNVTANEPFFVGHFPGHPIMPAVLIIEAMAQVGGVMLLTTVDDPGSKLVYFMGIDNARFRRPVRPGDQLLFDLQLVRLKSRTCQMSGKAYVRGQLVAEADLLSTIVDRENPPR
jgi:UDP-3-O-[3-hydroxymyristoyl] N-acetylglucosamine deacetylase / 3-hydroxyacyl-[acyl-carrier-protein] dehydratase